MRLIYKIVDAKLWHEAETAGIFHGAGIDHADGFIHLSNAGQVRKTAELFFAGVDGLVLVAVDAARLGSALVDEASRDGALFPHLYGPLGMEAVVSVRPMPLGPDGSHDLGEDIP